MKTLLILALLSSVTQSADAPFTVKTLVNAGDTVYVSVHCNSPSLDRPCLIEPLKDQDGKVFTLDKRTQSGSTQENQYNLKGSAPGVISIEIVPNRSFHKIHLGWNYIVIVEAKP